MERQWVFGTTPEAFKRSWKNRVRRLLVLCAVTVVLNLLLACLRTDATHMPFMLINIGTDIACGVYAVHEITCKLVPQRRLLLLSGRQKEVIRAEVTQVEEQTTRFSNLDCICVYLGKRRIFLPAGTLELKVGDQVELALAANVVMEVAK